MIAVRFLVVPVLWTMMAVASAQAPRDEFHAKQTKTKNDAGKRHLELGLWCRDEGLTLQATNEIIAADEIAEHDYLAASRVLGMMRGLDDKFWKTEKKNPGKALLDTYEQKATRIRTTDRKERFALADWAYKKKFKEEAKSEFLRIVRAEDRPLTFDKDGKLVLEMGTVPKDLSDEFKAAAVQINGKLYLRDEFLELCPDVREIFEESSKEVRVRTDASADVAKEFHAMAHALYEQLALDLGARPQSPLSVFIFKTLADYVAYAKKSGNESRLNGDAFVDSERHVTILQIESLTTERVQSAGLHELTRSFDLAVSRAVMPSWYLTAFAETYGGQGTYTWDGKELTTRLKMSPHRIEPLKTAAVYLPIKELLVVDGHKWWATDRDKAVNYVAEVWAFRRFLYEGVDLAITEKFRKWESDCRKTAVGADLSRRGAGSADAAQDLFMKLFTADFAKLEDAFKSYIEKL